MAKVQVTKTWTISPNVRYTPFVSLNLNMGWWLYENKAALVTAGWTLIGTSNGTTAAFDGGGGDRWTNATTGVLMRGLTTVLPQSWAVLENADGLQLCFAYQGAGTAPVGDDICRVSMSQAGIFTLAVGDPTRTPTATDEVIITDGVSVINATASADRVMSMGCTSKDWWNATFRAGAVVLYMACNEIDTACDSVTFAVPYAVCRVQDTTADSGSPGFGVPRGTVAASHHTSVPIGTTYRGPSTRVVTSGVPRIIRLGGGVRTNPAPPATSYPGCYGLGFYSAVSITFTLVSTPPALNNGTIPVLTLDWFGENTALMDGYLGSPIDWWYGHTSNQSVPAIGDMIAALAPGDTQATPLRSNWLVAIGSGVIRPWLNAAASLQTT
jgi:hypothetical protein